MDVMSDNWGNSLIPPAKKFSGKRRRISGVRASSRMAVFRGCHALYSLLSGVTGVRSVTTGFDVGLPYKTTEGEPTSPCGHLCQPPVAISKPPASSFYTNLGYDIVS